MFYNQNSAIGLLAQLAKKTKRKVFYSFHYEKDVMRASQIRNIGVIEGEEPVSDNAWEEVTRGGDTAIKNWIDNSMSKCSCVVVLVGEETASRPWIKYEIEKAWNSGKGVVGIYIHNIKCPNQVKQGYNGCSKQGENPFKEIRLNDNGEIDGKLPTIFFGKPLSEVVRCYLPSSIDAYNDIANKLELLVEQAIAQRTPQKQANINTALQAYRLSKKQ